MRKCSVKRVELVAIGTLVKREQWNNNGYIFTHGYHVRDPRPLPPPTPKVLPPFSRLVRALQPTAGALLDFRSVCDVVAVKSLVRSLLFQKLF